MLLSIPSIIATLASLSVATGYEVTISDKDATREVCSGMWASSSTYINGMPPYTLQLDVKISNDQSITSHLYA